MYVNLVNKNWVDLYYWSVIIFINIQQITGMQLGSELRTLARESDREWFCNESRYVELWVYMEGRIRQSQLLCWCILYSSIPPLQLLGDEFASRKIPLSDRLARRASSCVAYTESYAVHNNCRLYKYIHTHLYMRISHRRHSKWPLENAVQQRLFSSRRWKILAGKYSSPMHAECYLAAELRAAWVNIKIRRLRGAPRRVYARRRSGLHLTFIIDLL